MLSKGQPIEMFSTEAERGCACNLSFSAVRIILLSCDDEILEKSCFLLLLVSFKTGSVMPACIDGVLTATDSS